MYSDIYDYISTFHIMVYLKNLIFIINVTTFLSPLEQSHTNKDYSLMFDITPNFRLIHLLILKLNTYFKIIYKIIIILTFFSISYFLIKVSSIYPKKCNYIYEHFFPYTDFIIFF